MQFEIYRCGTMFCWRLLGTDGSLIANGTKQRRQRQQIEEDVLTMMDKLPDAHIIDKSSANTHVEVTAPTNGKARRGHGAHS